MKKQAGTQFTFWALSEDNSTYYDEVYQFFHPHVSEIIFNDEGTFSVIASEDFLERVFNRVEPDGSGLCQRYRLVS